MVARLGVESKPYNSQSCEQTGSHPSSSTCLALINHIPQSCLVPSTGQLQHKHRLPWTHTHWSTPADLHMPSCTVLLLCTITCQELPYGKWMHKTATASSVAMRGGKGPSLSSQTTQRSPVPLPRPCGKRETWSWTDGCSPQWLLLFWREHQPCRLQSNAYLWSYLQTLFFMSDFSWSLVELFLV